MNNFSRSEVSFFVNQEKPECALPAPGHAVTFLNLNEECTHSVVPGESVIGLTFEPLCMVVTIAPDSRRDLFDQLVEAGRPLDEKLRIEVNYTVGLEQSPNVESITTNCQNSFVLYDNYQLDRILQDEFDRLHEVRDNITRTQGLLEFLEYLLDNQPANVLRASLTAYDTGVASSSSQLLPPPPPDGASVEDTRAALENALYGFGLLETQLLSQVDGCVSSRTRSCGISSIEGPNPWLAKDGTPCRGYSSLSARVGDFCGYWDSEYNVDAAKANEKTELLEAGPWCFADDSGTTALECDGRAQRTQRAGVWEMRWWLRDDRHYCESKFFRSRVVPDEPAFLSGEACRSEIAKRNVTCYTECDTCKAFCSNSAARGVKDAWICTFGQPTLGIAAASQISDVGQHIITRHGAQRTKGRPPIPEEAWKEQFDLIVNNNVDSPRVPRNSISCRKEHRESRNGHYRPHLDDKGEPILRSGFMVGCDTTSDCYSRCGEHPIHGQNYVCTKNPRFYSWYVLNESSSNAFFIDEPGDERFDVEDHTKGVCTDVRMDFMHTGCESRAGAAAIVGMVGCTAKMGWNRAYCGALVERSGPDFLQSAISEASLDYPRILVPGGVFNGIPIQEVRCDDETACVNKCELYNRGARQGGLPAPEACALCEPICPSNIGTSLMDTVQALAADINTALKITRICLGELGFGGCICNVFMMLKPAWINNLPSPQHKCKGGNIFGLLVSKIVQLYARLSDDAINGLIIDPINNFLNGLPWPLDNVGRPIPRACLSGAFNPPRYDCNYGAFNNQNLLGCYDSTGYAAQHQCFFTRQRSICMDNSDRYERYQDLFRAPDAEELENRYSDIIGDSYELVDPTFNSLMQQVSNAQPDLDVAEAMQLCDASLMDSMDLDEIIVVCIFTFIEGFCPSSDSSERFQTFLNAEAVWQLPTVVFDWKAT